MHLSGTPRSLSIIMAGKLSEHLEAGIDTGSCVTPAAEITRSLGLFNYPNASCQQVYKQNLKSVEVN